MPAGGRNNRGDRGRLNRDAAKKKIIELISEGHAIGWSVEKVGYSYKTYELWRRQDESFKQSVDVARQLQVASRNVVRGERLGFEEWRDKYLGRRTYLHQQQWIDVLENKEPRGLHPAQTWKRGSNRNRILINCPPEHAKSQTITIDYVVYRICMDPSFRCIIVSASQAMAKRMVYGITSRLTHPAFADLQLAYAPEGGWQATADTWTKTEIYLDSKSRDGIEKDPTVQALGWGGQIYGARANLIILDDVVDKKSVRLWESQKEWLDTEPATRLGSTGKLLVIGTRMSPVDLYSELMNPEHYTSGQSPWNYLASPAILEVGEEDDGSDHVTLWPHSDISWLEAASDGDVCSCGTQECEVGYDIGGEHLYPRWDGRHIEQFRRGMPAGRFALVYLQASVSDDAIFPEHAIRNSTNGNRTPGLLKKETYGHPLQGMHNMKVIGGVDPAVSGHAGIVVIALDPETQKRYLLQAFNIKAPTPERLKQKILDLTEEYKVNEWRVESTGLLKLFTQDRGLREALQAKHVAFREHNTNKVTKWDPTYGVASMETLFGQYRTTLDSHGKRGDWECIADPLIEFPGRIPGNGITDLVHQLSIWTPELDPSKVPCDMVMALWFAEIGCREASRRGSAPAPYKGAQKFVSPMSKRRTLFAVS